MGGIAHLQSQGEGEAAARVRRLTPTDRRPRDSNHGPLDLKSSVLPLSYRPPTSEWTGPLMGVDLHHFGCLDTLNL